MANPIEIFSLCSGVGWLDLGVVAALDFLGIEHCVLGYCERDAYAASVLMARMEDSALGVAPVWCGNLEDMDRSGFVGRVGLLTAGFPCQPWSAAGKQKGTDDSRWLWPAIREIIAEVRPRMVFLENVPGLVSGCGLNHVLDSLAVLGFDAEWLDLEAAQVGASHKRRRVFILAHARLQHGVVQQRAQRVPEHSGSGGAVADSEHSERRPEHEVDGEAHGRDRLGRSGVSLGNAGSDGPRESWEPIHGQPEQQPGRADEPRGSGEQVADGIGSRLEIRPSVEDDDGSQRQAVERDCGIFAPGPSDRERWQRIIAERPWLAPAVESGLRVLVDGNELVVDEARTDQLRCAGNGVVPLQASVAFVELFLRLNQ